MNDKSRAASVKAGVAAGMAGLAVFLVLHDLLIVPIWLIAPVGVLMAGAGGAAVGAAYSELRPRLGRWRPIRVIALGGLVALIVAPSVVVAEIRGPIYSMEPGVGRLLVPALEAAAHFVVGLLGATALAAAIIGWLIARTGRAARMMALAGFALALGPGHNIPLLGGTPSVAKQLVILAAIIAIASLVLVVTEAYLLRRVRTG